MSSLEQTAQSLTKRIVEYIALLPHEPDAANRKVIDDRILEALREAQQHGAQQGARIAVNEFLEQYPEAEPGAVKYYADKELATFEGSRVVEDNQEEA